MKRLVDLQLRLEGLEELLLLLALLLQEGQLVLQPAGRGSGEGAEPAGHSATPGSDTASQPSHQRGLARAVNAGHKALALILQMWGQRLEGK